MDIKKVLVVGAIGTGVYLLLARKARAEEAPEEFTPAERLEDQITGQVYNPMPPSTIIEWATEEANIKIQQINEEMTRTIAEITEQSNEELAILKRKLESAYELKLEDLIQEYRARDEVVRIEADQKVAVARTEAAQQVEAARIEAERKVEAARIEAEKSLILARLSDKKIELQRMNEELQRQINLRDSACRVETKRMSYGGRSWIPPYPAELIRKYSVSGWVTSDMIFEYIVDGPACKAAKYQIDNLSSDKNRLQTQINELNDKLRQL